jgi:ADP-ribose pyrophosphatase YjhB (NUDIX family)
MSTLPLGTPQQFCSRCAAQLSSAIPAGDNKLRYVCPDCGETHYENPKMVVGCVAEHQGQILLCKRAIEPRLGYWTVPAGFMELGETVAEGAARETLEEACAKVELGSLLAMVNVPDAGQVHIFYRGKLTDGAYGVGEESLDTQLFSPADIPWDEIAFRSGHIALRQFLTQRDAGVEHIHSETVHRNRAP